MQAAKRACSFISKFLDNDFIHARFKNKSGDSSVRISYKDALTFALSYITVGYFWLAMDMIEFSDPMHSKSDTFFALLLSGFIAKSISNYRKRK